MRREEGKFKDRRCGGHGYGNGVVDLRRMSRGRRGRWRKGMTREVGREREREEGR